MTLQSVGMMTIARANKFVGTVDALNLNQSVSGMLTAVLIASVLKGAVSINHPNVELMEIAPMGRFVMISDALLVVGEMTNVLENSFVCRANVLKRLNAVRQMV